VINMMSSRRREQSKLLLVERRRSRKVRFLVLFIVCSRRKVSRVVAKATFSSQRLMYRVLSFILKVETASSLLIKSLRLK